jgi:hypothetical protein
MRFTLIWKPAAERRLAQIWIEAGDRKAITDAANAIDRALRYQPLTLGESRDGQTRILVEEPLVVVYEAREADRLVEIMDVRCVPARR